MPKENGRFFVQTLTFKNYSKLYTAYEKTIISNCAIRYYHGNCAD